LGTPAEDAIGTHAGVGSDSSNRPGSVRDEPTEAAVCVGRVFTHSRPERLVLGVSGCWARCARVGARTAFGRFVNRCKRAFRASGGAGRARFNRARPYQKEPAVWVGRVFTRSRCKRVVLDVSDCWARCSRVRGRTAFGRFVNRCKRALRASGGAGGGKALLDSSVQSGRSGHERRCDLRKRARHPVRPPTKRSRGSLAQVG
jgi:hypothetical protein